MSLGETVLMRCYTKTDTNRKLKYSTNRCSTIKLFSNCSQNLWNQPLKEFLLKKVAETSLKVVHQSAEQLFYRKTSTLRNTTFQLLHCNACKKQNMYVIQLLKDAQFSLTFWSQKKGKALLFQYSGLKK